MPQRKNRIRRKKMPLIRPPPFMVDGVLLGYSAGVFNSEGSQHIIRSKRRIRHPAFSIVVRACDKGMIEKVAKAWGVSAIPIRYPTPTCDPRFSGDAHTIWGAFATGRRARIILKRYKETGLLSKEKEAKAKELAEKWNLEAY